MTRQGLIEKIIESVYIPPSGIDEATDSSYQAKLAQILARARAKKKPLDRKVLSWLDKVVNRTMKDGK